MKNIFRICILLLLVNIYIYAASIHIVGSSTVYPFSSAVAEELSATSKYKTPLVESTGSGGGMKLFCSSSNNSPDIVNSSRKMKEKEFLKCKKNNIKSITEILIGYDGISLAQSKKTKDMSISKRELFLSLANEIPSRDGKKLIKNPYTKWNQINPKFPNRKIRIYGPPKSSGTRDVLEELVLEQESKKFSTYKQVGYKKYHTMRQDGLYIPSGENDNLIVKKLTKDLVSFGILGYSFLQENESIIKSIPIDGVVASINNILTNKYPIARSMYFYINNVRRNDAIDSYVKLFLSEDMMDSDEGYLTELGLIPMSKKQIKKQINNYFKNNIISLEQLK
jgi:phosphate transport system substrate-binding protein